MAVVVEPYNEAWPTQFQSIKAQLEEYLKDVPYLSIEHVGSTSVPGLAARPVIDIDIIVSRESLRPVIDALVSRGGFIDMSGLTFVGRWFLKDPNQSPPRNVCVCIEGAFSTKNHIGLRETLRRDTRLRDEYAAAKLEIASKATSIAEYTETKREIVAEMPGASAVLGGLEQPYMKNLKRERFSAISTERLVLREFVIGDDEVFHDLEGKEEVVRYQTYPPRTREEARESVAQSVYAAACVPRKVIELAVEHGGNFIGRVGAHVQRKAKPPHADLWFAFMPECQGRGFATEAMRAFIPLLGSPLELEIECDPRNTGSWKMAERLGFDRVSLTENAFECKGEWVGSLVYRKLV